MPVYNVTYIHPTEGGEITAFGYDGKDLNIIAGDAYFFHCETYDRCRIVDIVEVPPVTKTEKTANQKELDMFRPYLDKYMGEEKG